MTDTNDQITSGVDVSRDLHPTPLRLMRHREDVFRLAERFQWQSKKTDFEIPHSAIIVEDLRKFATASQMTPSRFSKYLVELDAVVEVFMYHNAYTFDVFKAGVLAHRKQHFPQFSWLSSSEAWRNIRETYERRIGPSSVEEALQRRIDNHLSATTSRIIGIIQIGAYLLDEFQYLQSLAEAIRSHLEESEWEIRQKKKEDYQDLDIKVRFAIAYLSFPEPDKLEPINEAYQLVLESVAFFNHTIRHLEILVGSFYQSQNLLHNMSNELSESGFRFLHWENPERMDQSLMAMNRSAVALRASKHAFDLGKQQNDRLLTV